LHLPVISLTIICRVQVYALPQSDGDDEHLYNVYNCLIESGGSIHPLLSPFPRQFALWRSGCFLHEPTNANIRPEVDIGGSHAGSGRIFFAVKRTCTC